MPSPAVATVSPPDNLERPIPSAMLETILGWQSSPYPSQRGLGILQDPAGFVITMPSVTVDGIGHEPIFTLEPLATGIAVSYRCATVDVLPSMVAALASVVRTIKAEDAKRPKVFRPRRPRGPNLPISPYQADLNKKHRLFLSLERNKVIKMRVPRKPKTSPV